MGGETWHARKLPRQYVCSQHFSEIDFTLGVEHVWTDWQFQILVHQPHTPVQPDIMEDPP